MPNFNTYRKQAKLLLRWHRDGNYSIGERIRMLDRYRDLTDREALSMSFPLALAQEIVAIEASYPDWTALKSATAEKPKAPRPLTEPSAIALKEAAPVLFVRDVAASAAFYRNALGFKVDFLHGHPAFYGSVSRDGARLHLKFVHYAVFGEGRVEQEELIMAFIPVDNVKALFDEYQSRCAPISQTLTRQAWGGLDFHVRDPDGNRIAFVG